MPRDAIVLENALNAHVLAINNLRRDIIRDFAAIACLREDEWTFIS